jgi:hypothetical protein
MPNFNPFSSDNDDTSFELGSPVNQAAKNVTKAASNKANDNAKAFAAAMRDQLYGSSTSSTPQEPGTDETNTGHTDNSNAASRAMSHAGGGTHNTSHTNANPNQTPEEQAKMEKIRHELFGQYSSKFRSAQNGAVNITTDLEQEMEKARQERKRKEEERKREEEEEERRKKEAKEKQQEFVTPAGKKTGMQMGKKQQEPIALRLSKVKTEINRGSTG